MSSTIFNDRLQALIETDKYPKFALEQLEKVAFLNGGKLPKNFFMENVGRATLANIFRDLQLPISKIEAPNGSHSSRREIFLC